MPRRTPSASETALTLGDRAQHARLIGSEVDLQRLATELAIHHPTRDHDVA